MTPLLAAIIAIESGGNDYARGRHGEVGPLQVRASVVRDVNRIYRTRYTLQQMTNRAAACDVFERYMRIYATRCALGRPVTDYDRARIWHRGPGGWRTDRSDYAQRVVAIETSR